MAFNDNELNDMEYKLALKYDNRTYFGYYCSLIKRKNIFIFSFFYNNDYNSKIIYGIKNWYLVKREEREKRKLELERLKQEKLRKKKAENNKAIKITRKINKRNIRKKKKKKKRIKLLKL